MISAGRPSRSLVRLLPLLAAAAMWALAGCSSRNPLGGGGGGGGGGQGATVHGPVLVYPSTVSVPVGGQIDFSAYLPSAPSTTSFSWQVSGSSAGTINSTTGVYTAPATVPSTPQVQITATASGSSGTAVVTITAAQGIVVSPAGAAVPAGAKLAFTATANGNPVSPVTWAVSGSQQGANYGTIDASGNYTAPITPPPGGAATITASGTALTGTASVQIQFSPAAFNGHYAFSYTGTDNAGDVFTVAGSFTADGAGNITGGLDDFTAVVSSTNAAGCVLTQNQSFATCTASHLPFTGTYTMGPDGRGVLTLTGTGTLNGTDTLRVALASNQHAFCEFFDSANAQNSFAGSGSGTIDLQKPADFSASAIAGHYAAQISGFDSGLNDVGIVGHLFSDGLGNFPQTASAFDLNDTISQTEDNSDTTIHGSYALDPAYGTTNGRGTLTITYSNYSGFFNGSTSVSYAFYIVDRTHLKLVETNDGTAASTSGDAFAAPAPGQITAFQNGGVAFTVGGAEQVGASVGPYAFGGVFISGAGNSISGGVLDENDAGRLSLNGVAVSSTGSSYSFNGSTGEVTLRIATSASSKTFAGYLTGTNSGIASVLLLEADAGVFSTGVAYPQTAVATPQGSFAVSLTGLAISSSTEQDATGQFLAASGGPTGTLDFNNAVVKSVTSPNAVLSGSTLSSLQNGFNGRGQLVLQTAAPSATFQLSYYVVGPSTVLLLETDSTRVMTGTLLGQF